MGMFDYVKYKCPCPYCEHPLEEFQSKDADCFLEEVEVSEVRRFYTSCPSCKEWVEFKVIPTGYTIELVSSAPAEK